MLKYLLVCMLTLSCKTPKKNDSDSSLEVFDSTQRGLGFETLDQYELSPKFLGALGERIGCLQASKLIAFPKNSLQNSLIKISTSRKVYNSIQDEFLNEDFLAKTCKDHLVNPESSVKSPAGFMRIYNKVRKAGYGLTFVMNGGYGSHLAPKGSIFTSRESWKALTNSDPNAGQNPLRVWRLECSNSYADDERCTKELISNIKERDLSDSSSLPHVYFFWGYSKGGNTSLQALFADAEIRKKTIGFVTSGSPIGGGIATLSTDKVIQQYAKDLAFINKVDTKIIDKMPLAAAMTPQSFTQYSELISEKELPEVLKGSKSLLPETRKAYLKELKQKDFSKEPDPIYGNKQLQIFHVAGLLDMGSMKPFPSITVRNGKLAPKLAPINAEHIQEIVFTHNYVDFPLTDAFVALQHAVIPKVYAPANVQTNLVGLLRIGHLSLNLSEAGPPSNLGIPFSDIVDAILNSVADRLEGGTL